MKESWEIKKLGEVCEIQGGSTPKRTESLYWDNGTYPWFTVEDIREQGRIITNTKQKITKKAWDKLRVFPEDTILLCCTASLGEYAITKIPLTSNQQFNGLTIKDKNYLSPMYLMHYCATLKNKLYALSGKATIDFVSAEKVKQISIPIPPLSEQEQIVAELDLISGIIEKKKQQLKELDSLAQSLFYEMFGNPVENEKGWEKIPFEKSIEKVKYTTKIPSCNYCGEGMFPIISQEDEYISGYWDNSDDVFKISKPIVIFGDHTRILKYIDFDFVLGADGVKVLQPVDTINARFFKFYLELSKIPSLGYSRHYKLLKELNVFTPPLSLQQEFASKVEMIEKQKELIKQSLKETETLFNSRMDFYFN